MIVSVETLGCGVNGHDTECLCDVIVTAPTPIAVRDAVNEMWQGHTICEMRNYGRPWTDASIVDYFADLTKGYDAWRSSGIPEIVQAREEGSVDLRYHGELKQIRTSVRSALAHNNPKPKIEIVLQALGYTAEQFTSAVTTNKWVVDIDTLNRFEARILEGFPSLAGLAREFGVSVEIAKNLFGYWNIPYEPKGATTKAAIRERMNVLIRQGLMPKPISDILESEFGIVVDRHTIAKAKARLQKKEGN